MPGLTSTLSPHSLQTEKIEHYMIGRLMRTLILYDEAFTHVAHAGFKTSRRRRGLQISRYCR